MQFNKYTHTHTHIPPWEDQCEWHRMTRMTGPDCAVMCNLMNTHTHTVIKSDSIFFLSSYRRLTQIRSHAALYKKWYRPMSRRFNKPPYSVSRATPNDWDCCRLPTASVPSNKADKSRSNQFRSSSPKFLEATRDAEKKENWRTEVYVGRIFYSINRSW